MSKLPDALLRVTYGLVPVFSQDDFDDVFEREVSDFTVGEQYQIRNELNRLCEPCEKVIDLRGEVDDKCKKFLHKGRIHYLDEMAIEAFEEGLELFGQYTQGIWEDVNNTGNNFRVQQAKAEQERLNALKCEQQRKADKLQHILATKLQYNDNHYPVHVIRFGDYFNRGEERMNYSVTAQLIFEDGRQMEGVTKDLSINGTYLRVPMSESVEMDELVKVKMEGQTRAYDKIAGQGIEYQVKRIEYIDKVIWLGLNRTFSEKKDEFTGYVKDLIITNKFVYKVNLDNAIDAALKQGHEQVFFARSATIPLFVETLGNQYRLRYALTCGLNEHELRFFSDEAGREHLTSLFSSMTLRGLINSKDDETLLYCFNHKVQGQLLYFAAFEQQLLDDPDMGRLFCGYGAKKDSWKIFKIKRVLINKTNANLLFTVPNRNLAQQEDEEAQNEPSTDTSPKPVDVGNLTHALLMTQISDNSSTAVYTAKGFDSSLMPKITDYQINYSDSGLSLQWVKYGLEELRHEPRFAYKTKVMVKFDNGMQLESTSADFSARGVQILLPRAVEVEQRDDIRLEFPLLQKITKQLQLSNLHYHVVRTENDQRTLYLQAVENEDLQHHGIKFFNDLIKRNRNKLTLVADSTEQQQLTKILKNLYQKVLATLPFYLNRVDGELRVTKFVNSQNPHPLFDLIKTDEFVSKVDISMLFANSAFATYIKSGMHKQKAGSYHRTIDLYIRHISVESDEEEQEQASDSFVIKTDADLNTPNLQRSFVSESLKGGQFYCLRGYMSEVVRVEVRKIADELEYIHHYAQHKSKRIAQLLTRINNVGEFVDITRFVLSYLQIEAQTEAELEMAEI